MLKISLLGSRSKQEISSHEAEEPCWNKCFIWMRLPQPQAGSCARVWVPHPCAKGRGSPAAAPAPLPCCIQPGDPPNPFCSSLHPARHLDGEAAGFRFFHSCPMDSHSKWLLFLWMCPAAETWGLSWKPQENSVWNVVNVQLFLFMSLYVTWQKGKFGERGERHW